MLKQRNIIKDNEELHAALVKRMFGDLELTQDAIIKDAAERGYVISNSQLSKYLNHHREIHSLTEENIIWLCSRWGIDLTLTIGSPLTATKWKVAAYNEEKAVNKLKLMFPNTLTPKPKTAKTPA